MAGERNSKQLPTLGRVQLGNLGFALLGPRFEEGLDESGPSGGLRQPVQTFPAPRLGSRARSLGMFRAGGFTKAKRAHKGDLLGCRRFFQENYANVRRLVGRNSRFVKANEIPM